MTTKERFNGFFHKSKYQQKHIIKFELYELKKRIFKLITRTPKKSYEKVRTVIFPKYKFPCEGCVVLPGGCSEICDKVETDVNKMKELFMQHKCCIDCGSKKFIEGPCGGLSQNIQCAKCGHKFNMALPMFVERI